MATAPLALGPGTSAQDRASQPLAAAFGGVAVTMLTGALIAAYLTLRSATGEWPPEAVEFDNYLGSTLTLTLLLSLPAIEWAVNAIRNGYRGQCRAALGIALGLGSAFLLGLWYLADVRIAYDAGAHAYAVITVAMLTVVAVSSAVALGYLLLSFSRASGSQITAANPHVLRAAGWYWHFAAAVWVAVWLAIFVTK